MVGIRLVGVMFATVLLAVAAPACGDDVVTGTRNIAPTSPTPRAAATVEGRIVDDFAPGTADRVAVIGVPAGETVPLRALPGVNQPVAGELPSNADQIYGFGESFETGDGRLWWLVRWQDEQGWIEPGAAYLGAAVDVTGSVGGVSVGATFGSVDELVDDVVAAYPGEPVVIDRRDAGVTVDVLADGDTIRGFRLDIETAGEPGAVRVASVTEVALCRRGVTDDGACR